MYEKLATKITTDNINKVLNLKPESLEKDCRNRRSRAFVHVPKATVPNWSEEIALQQLGD